MTEGQRSGRMDGGMSIRMSVGFVVVIAVLIGAASMPLMAAGDPIGNGLAQLAAWAQGWFVYLSIIGLILTAVTALFGDRGAMAAIGTATAVCVFGLAVTSLVPLLEGMFR